MFRYWAADTVATTPDVMTSILQWGPAGVVIVLLLTGVLITRGNHEDVKAERDRWQAAFEKERSAHELTRQALADANRTGAAAVETSKTTAALLDRLGHKTGRTGEP